MPALLKISDIGTVVAAAIDSQLCAGRVNWISCGTTGLIGVISRMTEEWVNQYMPESIQKLSVEQKNELIVFVLSALLCRLTDRKKNCLAVGFKAVQADLSGDYMIKFFGQEDKVLIDFPKSTVPKKD